ncbi:hypothetical protein PUN28_001537 [Cardiocondyla obscurior]|uniref:Uncharacterized protein n=1 Tax=Cardiocondyla obscurior TaxID=286306 RepID=A0AAW2H5W4_9HYME
MASSFFAESELASADNAGFKQRDRNEKHERGFKFHFKVPLRNDFSHIYTVLLKSSLPRATLAMRIPEGRTIAAHQTGGMTMWVEGSNHDNRGITVSAVA